MLITKFSIFEAQNRIHAGGNVFSNNHRSPNLPASCAMIDIDNISIVDNFINGIIEDKFTFGSKFLGNPMSASGTWQRTKLLDICNALNCDLLFKETSTNTIYKFQGNNGSISLPSLDGYNLIDTSDRLYVEIRYGQPEAVMFRTEGLKMIDLDTYPIFEAALKFTKELRSNGIMVSLYLVNDIIPGKIYIKKYLPVSKTQVENTHLIDISNPNSWISVYGSIGLL